MAISGVDEQLKTAQSFHQRGDYAHSIPILMQLVRISPRDYSSNLLLGEDLFRSGRPRDALGPLRVASGARPNALIALDYTIAAAEALGDFATESEALEAALARSHRDEQHVLAWGAFCLQRFKVLQSAMMANKEGQATELRFEAWGSPEGSPDRESLLEQSSALDPQQRGIWGELGIAQFDLGERAQTQTTLRVAEQSQPHAAETLWLEALLAAAIQDWEGAEKRLLSLGAQSPAELKRTLEAWPQAMIPGPEIRGTIWGCLRSSTDSCEVHSGAPENNVPTNAQDLFAEGRWEELAALPEPAPSSHLEALWRGIALAKTGACLTAIPMIERGVTTTEREGVLYLQDCYANEESRAENRLSANGNAGAFHELKGDRELIVGDDPAAAENDYKEALKSRPRDPRLLAQSAEAGRLSGNQANARAAALGALAIDPHQTEALQTLAEIALYQRNYSEAAVRLRQMVALQPGNAWSKVELGVAYAHLERPEDAVRYLEPPLTAGYPDPKGELHAQLAVALGSLGRRQEAQRAAAEASRLANTFLQNGAYERTDVH